MRSSLGREQNSCLKEPKTTSGNSVRLTTFEINCCLQMIEKLCFFSRRSMFSKICLFLSSGFTITKYDLSMET